MIWLIMLMLIVVCPLGAPGSLVGCTDPETDDVEDAVTDNDEIDPVVAVELPDTVEFNDETPFNRAS